MSQRDQVLVTTSTGEALPSMRSPPGACTTRPAAGEEGSGIAAIVTDEASVPPARGVTLLGVLDRLNVAVPMPSASRERPGFPFGRDGLRRQNRRRHV